MNGRYIDISSFQGPPHPPINWATYVAWAKGGDGLARLCLRVDQGVGDGDTDFELWYSGARAAGVQQFIFYHMAYPWLHPNWQGAQEEVSSFLSILGSRIGPDDLLMLDAESVNGQSGPAEWYYDWLHLCSEDAHLPVSRVAIYANSSYIANHLQHPGIAAFPLVLAAWTGKATPPPAPLPWTSLLAWQWTDQANVSGVPEPVDADFFLQPSPTPPPPGPNVARAIADLKDALAALGG